MLNHHDVLDIKYSLEEIKIYHISFKLDGNFASNIYTGISALLVLYLFGQFCLVFLYPVSLWSGSFLMRDKSMCK